jgi:hypothetical protein
MISLMARDKKHMNKEHSMLETSNSARKMGLAPTLGQVATNMRAHGKMIACRGSENSDFSMGEFTKAALRMTNSMA